MFATTTAAVAATGPYSQATVYGESVLVPGRLSIDPATGALSSEDATERMSQCVLNIAAIARTAGPDRNHEPTDKARDFPGLPAHAGSPLPDLTEDS